MGYPTLLSIHFPSQIAEDIDYERARQEEIGRDKRSGGIEWRSCADPDMAGGDPMRYAVLGEEVGEVARAILEGDPDHALRAEIVQVAAVAVAWIAAIDERSRP